MTTRQGKTTPFTLVDNSNLMEGKAEPIYIENLPPALYSAKVWAVLVSQAGVAAPTVQVQRNDFAADGVTITPARVDPGEYTFTFSSAVLLAGKVQVFIGTPDNPLHVYNISSDAVTDNRLNLFTYAEAPAGTYTLTDALLSQVALQVILYP